VRIWELADEEYEDRMDERGMRMWEWELDIPRRQEKKGETSEMSGMVRRAMANPVLDNFEWEFQSRIDYRRSRLHLDIRCHRRNQMRSSFLPVAYLQH